jgi:hypothetical protein
MRFVQVQDVVSMHQDVGTTHYIFFLYHLPGAASTPASATTPKSLRLSDRMKADSSKHWTLASLKHLHQTRTALHSPVFQHSHPSI